MLNRFDENGNAEIENQADQWEEQQAILQAEADAEAGKDSGQAAP